MEAERWQRINDLFLSALEREPESRPVVRLWSRGAAAAREREHGEQG